MTVHDSLLRLGESTSSKVVALWEKWQAGEMNEDQFRAAARAVLVRAGAQSTALADLALAAALTVLSGRVVAPQGLAPTRGDEAAEEALRALDSDTYVDNPGRTVSVLGAAFAYEAFQSSFQVGQRQVGVAAWTRSPEPGACKYCQGLVGETLPASVDMWHHPGCRCVPQPVLLND